MDNSSGGLSSFRLTAGRTAFMPPNNQPMLFRPQQQQLQQAGAGLPGSSQQFGGTPLVTPPVSMPASGNIMQAAQASQQQQQFGVPANGGAPTLLAAIKAMQAAAAAQGKTLAPPNGQQQSQVPAQAMPAPVRQPSGLQALPARPQQQRRPAASQPSAPPASKDHQALLQQVQAALAKAQQQQQQQQKQQQQHTYKRAPPPPAAAAAGFSAELPAPASRAAAQGQEAAAGAGPQRPHVASDELLQLVQAQLQKQQQQQQRAPTGPTRQPSNAAVAAAAAPAAGQRPAAPGMDPIQQQLLQQVLAVVAANGSSNVHPAAGASGASAMQAMQQQPAAEGAHMESLTPGFGAGLTPQQQQLLQQILSATGIVASTGSGPAGAQPNSQAGGRTSCAAPAAVGLAAAAGFEAAGVAVGQPATAVVSHTVVTPCAGQQGASSKGPDMAALLQQLLRPASAPRPPNSSTPNPNTNKGVDQQVGTQQQPELQPEGLSTEVLTLLTMIAASAVYGAAESSASGRPLSAVVNSRVLSASKRFLSVLVSMNDSSSTDGEDALEAMAAAAAAGAPLGGGASDTHAAAAALCSLPEHRRGISGDGPVGGRPGWAVRGGEEHGEWYAPDEPLVGGSRRERHTAGSRARAGRPPTGYSRGGGGAKPQGSAGGGRCGLLALLRAVEETDQACSDAGEDPMDWAAAAAEPGGAADVGADDDQPDRSYGGRGRRTRGKRPRGYATEHSSIHSDSYSYDSTGQDSSRRWDAAAAAAAARSEAVGWSDREQDQGEQEDDGSRRQRQRTGYTHGRIRRTNDDNYIYGDALDSVADAALLAAAAAAGGQRGSGKPGPKAAAPARAPSPAAAAQQGHKRQRCVAGANQWMTEDGLTVWPKDTVVTRDQRVFYVAFKWVQEHWPRNVEEGEHIADVPISLFLDNQEVPNLVYNFKAKIRVYNTAAHLVISPYSKLSAVYSGCFIAGYAYNHHTGAIRVYLTRERPDLSAPPGRPIRQQALHQPGDDAVPRQHHIPPADPAAAAAMPAPADPAAAAAMPAPADPAAVAAMPAPADLAAVAAMPASAERSSGGATAAADTGLDRAFAAAMAVADELPQLQALVNAAEAHDPAAGGLPTWAAAAEPAAQATANGVAHDDTIAGSRAATVCAAAALEEQQQQQPEETQADAAAAAATAAPVAASPSSGTVDQQQAAADAAAAPSPQQAASASSSDVGGSDGGPDAQRWEQLQQQLGTLQARDVPVDASVINNAVLSVSDALQLPDDLLAELPNRLLQTLQAATAAGSSGVGSQPGRGVEGAAADGGSDAVAQAGSDSGKGAPPSPDAVLAALQGWYKRLCGAVAARDGQQVTKLVKQLGHEVLVAGQ